MRTEILDFTDFINDILPSELHSQAQNRQIQVVSDFDETECSMYFFSDKWKTHVPKIRVELAREAQQLVRPMCLATARTPTELVSWVMWQKLSKAPMSLVAENGAVLVWPLDRITQPPQIKVLATDEQIYTIELIQRELESGSVNDLQVPTGHEVVLRSGRAATIELRAQEIESKKGTPDDYTAMTQQLKSMLPNFLPHIDMVSSGSSLGIQPRGISKELGIETALTQAGVSLKDVFLVGLGDNNNDKPLFDFVKQHNGMTIGVRPTAQGLCDFMFDGGDEVSLQVLKTINSFNKKYE